MLSTTEAIVLALQPLSDRAHLLHAYTRTGGRVNCKVYGLGRRHAAGIYTPFSLIQLTGDLPSFQGGGGGRLPSVRTAQLLYVPTTTTTDMRKQAVAMFLSEVLYLTLRHPMPDEPMFDFLAAAVRELDATDQPQNFHLSFLVDFAAQLGFAIPENENLSPFTFQLSTFISRSTLHSRAQRQEALRTLCAYFAEHVDAWQSPKSLDILMEVFD